MGHIHYRHLKHNITVNVTPPGLELSESFDAGNIPAGWSSNGGSWSDPGSVAQVTTSGSAWNTYSAQFADGSVAADVKITRSGPSAAGITFRTNNNGTQGYSLVLDQSAGKLRLLRDNTTEVASQALNVVSNRTYRLKVVTSGSSISCYLDGVLVFETTNSTYTSGQFGLYGNNGTLQFDNVLTEASPQSATLQFQANSFDTSNNVQVNQSCTDGSGAVCINYIQNGELGEIQQC